MILLLYVDDNDHFENACPQTSHVGNVISFSLMVPLSLGGLFWLWKFYSWSRWLW